MHYDHILLLGQALGDERVRDVLAVRAQPAPTQHGPRVRDRGQAHSNRVSQAPRGLLRRQALLADAQVGDPLPAYTGKDRVAVELAVPSSPASLASVSAGSASSNSPVRACSWSRGTMSPLPLGRCTGASEAAGVSR
ncbi:hypothetical protein ACFV9W_01710 [Streptomyces sp. NPDC059897]|uniref:hypothetical protein n=1 Tax=Streptomyces sp. NPDC059897 TaxID=3346994 RepID=UPI00366372CD